jgi:hypothetical protein
VECRKLYDDVPGGVGTGDGVATWFAMIEVQYVLSIHHVAVVVGNSQRSILRSGESSR